MAGILTRIKNFCCMVVEESLLITQDGDPPSKKIYLLKCFTGKFHAYQLIQIHEILI